MKTSIIIPTLNEERFVSKTILHTLKSAANPGELEVIVVDAGSTDNTLKSISDMPVIVFSKPDFKLQKHASLNFGLSKAQSEVVLFLDADTLLPEKFDELIQEELKNKRYVGGAFDLSFDQADFKLKMLLFFNRVRYRLGKIFYGDQAVFCRKSFAEEVGGFPPSLMEAAFFCKKMKKKGKLAIIKKPVITSSRRFTDHGFFKVTWFDLRMLFRFMMGWNVSRFGESYWKENLKNG